MLWSGKVRQFWKEINNFWKGKVMVTKVIKEEAPIVAIYELGKKEMYLRLRGETSLIVHRFSAKTKDAILKKQQKKATKAKEARDPEAEYLAAMYIIDKKKDLHGFPAAGFKKTAVRAGVDCDMKMTQLRGRFHVFGLDSKDFITIDTKKGPIMREDTVRLATGTTDLRYRPEYVDWSCTLRIVYNSSVITPEQIINLYNIAGFAVGVGEWRPERNGQFGMFEIETDKKSKK